MPKLGKITDIDPQRDYSNNCKDGRCSQCDECCADLLPLSPDEIKRIKAYMKAHPVKMHHRNYPIMQNQYADLTCPFRNNAEKKCDIYDVRPLICRSFICSKTMEHAIEERDFVSKSRATRSMRYEFFGDRSTLDLVEEAHRLVYYQMFWEGGI